ncbi:hypothetical protein SAY87_011554 [Trapa incisa]|uniref:Uncharacterized protein n=1 Tax=Trapa incisa TaxID=236973 RepID=A0AAN7GZJ1_9MYRT|nr:hypothetical protein SAY87_011554 [Trapa incisa]
MDKTCDGPAVRTVKQHNSTLTKRLVKSSSVDKLMIINRLPFPLCKHCNIQDQCEAEMGPEGWFHERCLKPGRDSL